MNCKKGDLAVIVRSEAGNEGKFVTCIRLSDQDVWIDCSGRYYRAVTWVVDRKLVGADGISSWQIEDSLLRPIRDSDGTDEMLRIAGLPKRDEVKA